MAAPNIGPMFWQSVPGKDGVNRQIQWQARVEGALGEKSERKDNLICHKFGTNREAEAITISQYLGTGSTSRGRLAITSSLSMTVAEHPYLHDQNDVDAVIAGIEDLQKILSNVPNLTWSSPAPDECAAEYVNNVSSPSYTICISADVW